MDGSGERNRRTGMRAAIAVFSIIILLSLMTYSYIEHDDRDPYMAYIIENSERFRGKEIDFVGRVVSLNASSVRLRLMEPPYSIINVGGEILNNSLHKGDVVEVLGIYEVDNVTAEKTFVIKSFEYRLIFFRSLPAIPFVAYLFFKKWKFNFKKFMFEERECQTGRRM